MAKLPYSWNKVVAGDIISFVYESKEGKKLRRTVLVLDPKFKNRTKNPRVPFFLIGLQLEISNVAVVTNMKRILEAAGVTEAVDTQKKIYRVRLSATDVKTTYKKMRGILDDYSIYRTYDYKKATKGAVMLEDLKLPTGFTEEIKKRFLK